MLDFHTDSAAALSLDFSLLEPTPCDALPARAASKFEDFAENGVFHSLALAIPAGGKCRTGY